MKTISDKALAYLLKITTKEAAKLIYACKNPKKRDAEIKLRATKDDLKSQSIEVKNIEKYMNIDLVFAIKNIQEKYLLTQATKDFIRDYPQTKIDKSDKIPNSISIPSGLSELLTEKQKSEIIKMWESHYSRYENLKFTH